MSDRGRAHPFAGRRGRLLPGAGPLSRVPPVAVFALVAALFAVGVIVGGVLGAVLLGLLVVGVGVLLATTWARLSPPERLGRALVLAVLVAVTVATVLR